MSQTIFASHTDSERDQLRIRLFDERESAHDLVELLSSMMNSFTVSQRGIVTDDEHDPEGPSIAVQRSEAMASLGQSRHHYDEINAAIVRMESNSYGVCEHCSMAIPFARLDARPHATHCISCAQKLGR